VDALYANSRITRDLVELRNLVQVADVQSAQARHESLGLHYRIDHPSLAPTALPTLLSPASA
jgi:L-aspartate oxidase